MHNFFITNEWAIVFLGGCIGALADDMLKDGAIEMPKFEGGKLYFGFLGGILAGGLVGYLTDGSFVSSLAAGFAGASGLPRLLAQIPTEREKSTITIADLISNLCLENGVDPELALRVARAESALTVTAINKNTDGSRDRGIFQINDKYHPEVTDAEAFDPTFSTNFFCKAFKDGHLDWWKATAHVWDTTGLLT